MVPEEPSEVLSRAEPPMFDAAATEELPTTANPTRERMNALAAKREALD
jgi:hypothetical protein